jgi:hypothetical protein
MRRPRCCHCGSLRVSYWRDHDRLGCVFFCPIHLEPNAQRFFGGLVSVDASGRLVIVGPQEPQ